ncbi:two-component system chemotaxis family CheB-CheR fusion protein [Salinisphaera shabanensis E1L3A]|uniref:histidine kinase n=1 Tax=Salinisphaera shabanensis E1L3A TaxID=1033802 RepID=U2E116_9GAMM|nr:CheR family methyltransferase [Salinisphaera shabanensis]ERJ17616.1 two-component system chemotaxis family CheB-CheR fusion protein [Salinisphaera shabanensis E1L3A]
MCETKALAEPLCNHLEHNLATPHPIGEKDQHVEDEDENDNDFLHDVLGILRQYDKKRDFSAYKPNMLKRRIQRRMGLIGTGEPDAYRQLLQQDGAERENLSQDFFDLRDRFFRDSEAYAALYDTALPTLLEKRDTEDSIRVWVPGCATGEEAYSIAMALDEAIHRTGRDYRFIVFASDVDQRALKVARAGFYPESIAADVSPSRLRAYFDKPDDHYRVKRRLRRVVFAAQNVIEDPPYSRLDLISCRNLLMYLKPEIQKKAIATFHFALNARGLLLLGSSETLSGQIDLFEPINKSHRLFQRIGSERPMHRGLPFAGQAGARDTRDPTTHAHATTTGSDIVQVTRDLLLRDFVPPAVLVNRKFEILCSYGPVHRFLALPMGASSLSLMEMVHATYRSHLRAIIHRALRDSEQQAVVTTPHDEDPQRIQLTARPLQFPEAVRGLVFVTFESLPHVGRTTQPQASTDTERQLADELESTRRELHTTIQALEASNEDFKASNEEILSMNEELQSTNEELETSKEELQSVNEELTTVNTELENKVGELETAHNDLQNLFSGTDIATLFLDRALCIKRFTPAIKELLNLIASDIGRPLSDISLKFDDPDLETDADHTMADLVTREKEIKAGNGRWYLRRTLPYRIQDNAIDGIVMTFADISDLKRASLGSEESEHRLDLAMGAIDGGMWDMQIDPARPDDLPDHVYLSSRLKHLLGFENDQFPNSLRAWEERILDADRDVFRDLGARREAASAGVHYRARHRDGRIRWFASHGQLVEDTETGAARWIGIDRDITEHKLVDRQALQARARLELLADNVCDMVGYLDREGVFEFVNKAFAQRLGVRAEDVRGRPLEQVFGDDSAHQFVACLEAVRRGDSATCHVSFTNGDKAPLALTVSHIPHRMDDHTTGFYIIVGETDRRGRRDDDRIDQRKGLVHLQRLATVGEMTRSLSHDLKQPLSAINTYAGTLKRMIHAGRDAEQTTALTGKIAEQVQHAADMVSATRDFVRERGGEQDDEDLNDLVHRALALVDGLAGDRQVETQLELHSPLPPLYCQGIQIEQVIVNLLINAIHAVQDIQRGQRTVRVQTRPVDNQTVELCVSDSGEGIPGDKLGRIFDAFYTSKLEGTGLGLSLSKTIVESHGGQMWAESALDAGAAFFVRLPIRESGPSDGELP